MVVRAAKCDHSAFGSAQLRLVRLSAVAQQIRACPQILPRKYTGWVLKRDMAKSRAWSACSGVNLA